MDILLPFNFTALLLLSSFILFLIKAFISSKSPDYKYRNLPPGPPRLPIIGHLHHLIGTRLPHDILARMAQKYGPIMHLQIGEISTFVLSSPETAKELLKVQDPACAERPEIISSKIMWSRGIIFSPYGEYWRQMRKICIVEMLSAKNVKSYDSIRKEEVSRLMNSIRSSAGEPINLSNEAILFTSSMTSRVSFGKVARENDALIDLLKEAVSIAGWFELADLFPSSKLMNVLSLSKRKMLRLKGKVDAILEEIVEEHRLKRKGEFGGEDLIDVLFRISRQGDLKFPITNETIKAIIRDIFSAGTETSSTTMSWAMAELMRNPQAMTKLQKEVRQVLQGKETIEENELQKLTYLKQVIKETLRLHPPLTLLARACRDECKLEGYSIPAKSKVIVNTWMIGRDPKYWHEPEAFLPERFDNSSIDYLGNNFEFIPFGAGRRICPGMNFGVANIMLPMSQMLYHFNWGMPKGMSPNDMDMTERYGVSIGRKSPVVLVPTAYNYNV